MIVNGATFFCDSGYRRQEKGCISICLFFKVESHSGQKQARGMVIMALSRESERRELVCRKQIISAAAL